MPKSTGKALIDQFFDHVAHGLGEAELFKSPEGRRREVVVYSHQFACSEDISPNVAALKGLFSPGWTEKHTQKERISFKMQKLAKELSVVVPEMSLNVNTANNIGLGGSFYSISESDWIVMRTRLDDATQFLQQSRGIETG
ncbi:hypothetical protein YC2023_036144 [Brassica napus]|uniref:Uncharacterized protein n=2 Tax=Brassica TaxID=3705 RepID=A0A0D3B540_BRAOL|nr:unnamed protein product [Brassica napus]